MPYFGAAYPEPHHSDGMNEKEPPGEEGPLLRESGHWLLRDLKKEA